MTNDEWRMARGRYERRPGPFRLRGPCGARGPRGAGPCGLPPSGRPCCAPCGLGLNGREDVERDEYGRSVGVRCEGGRGGRSDGGRLTEWGDAGRAPGRDEAPRRSSRRGGRSPGPASNGGRDPARTSERRLIASLNRVHFAFFASLYFWRGSSCVPPGRQVGGRDRAAARSAASASRASSGDVHSRPR